VCSGLDLSPSSSSSGSSRGVLEGGSAEAAEADAAGRIPVKDRLVWEEPHLSKKKKWRHRKAEQLRAAAAAETAAVERCPVAPEWHGHYFNCGRRGHRKQDCTFAPLCLRCGNEGHETKDCKRPLRWRKRSCAVRHWRSWRAMGR
jgi:hypothetical protein